MGLPVGGVISALVSGSRKLDFPNKTLFTESCRGAILAR